MDLPVPFKKKKKNWIEELNWIETWTCLSLCGDNNVYVMFMFVLQTNADADC